MAGVLISLQPGLGAQEIGTNSLDGCGDTFLSTYALVNLDPQLRSDGGRAYTSAAWTWRTGAPAVAPILGRNSLDGCGDTFLSTYALVNLDPQLRSDGGRAYTSAAWTWSAYSGSTIGTKQLGWMWRYLPLYVCPGQLGPTAQMAGVLIRLYPGRQVQTDLPFRMGTVAQWRLW